MGARYNHAGAKRATHALALHDVYNGITRDLAWHHSDASKIELILSAVRCKAGKN